MRRPAIVIVTFKRQELLANLFGSIERLAMAPWRVVVVDNEDSERTAELARSNAELDQFEALLNEEDQWLYGWIIERDPTPPEFETPVMAKVRAFMRAHVAAEVGKGIG